MRRKRSRARLGFWEEIRVLRRLLAAEGRSEGGDSRVEATREVSWSMTVAAVGGGGGGARRRRPRWGSRR